MSLSVYKKINRSFSAKVFASLLAVMILLTSTVSLFSLHAQRQNFEKELLREGRMLARVLADNSRLGLFAMDNEQLQAAVMVVLGADNVVGACIYDLEGRLLQRNTAEPWEKSGICRLREQSAADFAEPDSLQEVRHYESEKTFEFWSPVLAKPAVFSEEDLFFQEQGAGPPELSLRIGLVGVVFDKTELHQSIREMLIKNILILLFFLGIGSFATYYLVREATGPLNRLLGEIRRQGGSAAATDDLGLLSDTFSNMVRKLSGSFATINDLKTGLEEKVKELEQEITRRRQTEFSLRESEEKFRNISEGIADGVAIVRNGRLAWANKAIEAIFACSATELIGREAAVLLPQPGKHARSPWLLDCLGGMEKQVRYLTMTRRNDGREILVEVKARKIAFEHKEAIQAIVRDITEEVQAEKERKELEVKALTQSKLASLGKIATGVAHEINQPLSYIKIVFESALRDIDSQRLDPAESRQNFQESLRQVGRITLITDHLRSFGRTDTSLFAEVQVSQVLNNSLTLMREILRLADITLETDVAGDLPPVRGNSVQLEQIFINLVQNSVDALAETSDRRIRIVAQEDGDMLEIRFSDSGPGIPPEARNNIFEPFYSTKSLEERSGLGLAIVNTIIREHRGTITYLDLPGWGASFVIRLPVSSEAENESSGPLGQGPDNI
ncbi:MAG: sensor histidine kinase [Desulfobulbaceae bacterium]